MKKLIFILTLASISLASMAQNIKRPVLVATDTLKAEQELVWQNHQLKFDSLAYIDWDAGSLRVRRFDGSWIDLSVGGAIGNVAYLDRDNHFTATNYFEDSVYIYNILQLGGGVKDGVIRPQSHLTGSGYDLILQGGSGEFPTDGGDVRLLGAGVAGKIWLGSANGSTYPWDAYVKTQTSGDNSNRVASTQYVDSLFELTNTWSGQNIFANHTTHLTDVNSYFGTGNNSSLIYSSTLDGGSLAAMFGANPLWSGNATANKIYDNAGNLKIELKSSYPSGQRVFFHDDIFISGKLTTQYRIYAGTMDNATTDLNKFVVANTGGELEYRTGDQLFSDLNIIDSLNTGGILNNVAYLDQLNVFEVKNTFQDSVLISSDIPVLFGNSAESSIRYSTSIDGGSLTAMFGTNPIWQGNQNQVKLFDNAGNLKVEFKSSYPPGQRVFFHDDVYISGSLRTQYRLYALTIDQAASDVDKFLVSNAGEIEYVTGANLLAYIDGVPKTRTITLTQGTGMTVTNSGVAQDLSANRAWTITHNAKAWVDKTALSGANVISNLTIDASGHPTNWTTRALTKADLGIVPAALTKVDDTNVTLTLGGTPATSLLQATSLTLGWTGTLAASRGGFGSDVSAQTGLAYMTTGTASFKTIGINDNNIIEVDATDISIGRYGVWTANGLDGWTKSEVWSDINTGLFTAGSVLFAGSSGEIGQDNADFNYNSATNILSVKGGVNYGSRRPIGIVTGDNQRWYKLGSLSGQGARVSIKVIGQGAYGEAYTNVTHGTVSIGNANGKFGAEQYEVGPYAGTGTNIIEYKGDAGTTELDVFVRLGTYFKGSIDITNGNGFTLNDSYATPLTDPSGIDAVRRMVLRDPLVLASVANNTTTNNILVLNGSNAEVEYRTLDELFTSEFDNAYLRLDTSNDPLTNDLTILKTVVHGSGAATLLTLDGLEDGSDMIAGDGVQILFRIPYDDLNSVIGSSISAVKSVNADSDSSTDLVFKVSQNDEILDEALRLDYNLYAFFSGNIQQTRTSGSNSFNAITQFFNNVKIGGANYLLFDYDGDFTGSNYWGLYQQSAAGSMQLNYAGVSGAGEFEFSTGGNFSASGNIVASGVLDINGTGNSEIRGNTIVGGQIGSYLAITNNNSGGGYYTSFYFRGLDGVGAAKNMGRIDTYQTANGVSSKMQFYTNISSINAVSAYIDYDGTFHTNYPLYAAGSGTFIGSEWDTNWYTRLQLQNLYGDGVQFEIKLTETTYDSHSFRITQRLLGGSSNTPTLTIDNTGYSTFYGGGYFGGDLSVNGDYFKMAQSGNGDVFFVNPLVADSGVNIQSLDYLLSTYKPMNYLASEHNFTGNADFSNDVNIIGNVSAANIKTMVFSNSFSDSPDERWYEIKIPFIAGSGSSKYYYFEVVGFSDIGTMQSQLSYTVYLHNRAVGTAVNSFDYQIVANRKAASKGFNFYKRVEAGTNENVFIIHIPEDYSGLAIYAYPSPHSITNSMISYTDVTPSGMTACGFATSRMLGNAVISGTTTLETVAAGTSGLNKYLVSDSGVVKSLTAAAVLSDIGGASASSISGTAGYYSKFLSGGSSIGNASILFENDNTLFLHERPTYGGFYILANQNASGTSSFALQAGQGSNGFGGGLIMYGHSHESAPGWVRVGLSESSGGYFAVNTKGLGGGVDVFKVSQTGEGYFADNLGLGVIPSDWYYGSELVRVIQLGGHGTTSIFGSQTGGGMVGNAYLNTSAQWKRVKTGYASFYNNQGGQHIFYVADTGAADTNITWNTALTLDQNLKATFKNDVIISEADYPFFHATTTSGSYSVVDVIIGSNAPLQAAYIGTTTNHPVKIQTNSTVALSIDALQNSTFYGNSTITTGASPKLTLTDTRDASYYTANLKVAWDATQSVLLKTGASDVTLWSGKYDGSKFFILPSGGVVGIATTDPKRTLDVRGFGFFGDATAGITVGNNSNIASLYGLNPVGTTYYPVEIRTGAHGTGFYQSVGGDVGFGTIPIYPVHILRNVAADTRLEIENDYSGYGAWVSTNANSDYSGMLTAGLNRSWLVGSYGTSSFTIRDRTASANRFEIDVSGNGLFYNNLTIGSGAAGTDYFLKFDGESNNGYLYWMEDEAYFTMPKLLIGSSYQYNGGRDQIGIYVNSSSGSTVRYYKIATLPPPSGSTYDILRISGTIGGWTDAQGKASVEVVLANRDNFRQTSHVTGTLGYVDIKAYDEADGSVSVYVVANYYYNFNLNISGVNYTNSYDGSYITSTPSGTEIFKLSTDYSSWTERGGNFKIAGRYIATGTGVSDLAGQLRVASYTTIGAAAQSTYYLDVNGKTRFRNESFTINGVEYKWPSSTPSDGTVLTYNGGFVSWGSGSTSGGISSINGQTNTSQTIAGTSPIAVSSASGTHTVSISQANATTNGYLSSTDWTSFNSRLPYTGAGASLDMGAYGITATGITASTGSYLQGAVYTTSITAGTSNISFGSSAAEYMELLYDTGYEYVKLKYNNNSRLRTTSLGVIIDGILSLDGNYSLPSAAPTANGQVLAGNTDGTTSWVTPTGGSATPGGSSGEYQYNDGTGGFAASSNFYQSGGYPVSQFYYLSSTNNYLEIQPTYVAITVNAASGTRHFEIHDGNYTAMRYDGYNDYFIFNYPVALENSYLILDSETPSGNPTSNHIFLYVNSSGELAYKTSSGAIRTLTYNQLLQPNPAPEPPSEANQEQMEALPATVLHQIEYNADFSEYRKVLLQYQYGALVSKVGLTKWKKITLFHKLLIK